MKSMNGAAGGRLKRWAFPTLLVMLAIITAPAALASNPYGKFLSPDQAFQLKASTTAHAIVLDWKIADGYYLYRSKFRIHATHGAVAKAHFPLGVMETDPNFGRVEIYQHAVRVTLPYTTVPTDGKIALAVTYQGCAKGGICYPPVTKHLSLSVNSPMQAATGGSSSGGGGGGTLQSTQGHLASLIVHANPFWFFAVFFGLGVLLSFTPCVLPMVPILAGILGKNRAGGARRSFFLSLVYVLAMAVVYTAAGVAAGFAGTGLQGFFQTPWVIMLFAAVFVVMALSLFGVYDFRLPSALTNRLNAVAGRADGASWYGAAAMGALAALVVSPCIAAPIAGALVVIGQAGEPVRGGLALAALSLGMGAPLIVYGTVAGRLIPKAGGWMIFVERLLGIAMLAYAVWLLGRIVPAPVVLVLWGAIGVLATVLLGVFTRPVFARRALLTRGVGALIGVASAVLIIGGATGGTSPITPLAGLRSAPQTTATQLAYTSVQSLTDLQTRLAQARASGQPVMVEFRADWCTSCLEMERTTLREPSVRKALSMMTLLKVDVTDNTPAERTLLKHFGLYGPPAYIFFNRDGQILHAQEVVGYTDASEFLPHARVALASVTAHPDRK